MRRYTLFLVSVVAVQLLSAGCATISHGSYQTIDVSTTPAGATASCAGARTVTPGQLRIKRKTRDAQVNIELNGFEPVTISLKRVVSGKLAWNAAAVPVG